MDDKQRKKDYLYRKYTELIEKIQKIRDEKLDEEVKHSCFFLWREYHILDYYISHWGKVINQDTPIRRSRFANCDSNCASDEDIRPTSPTF